MKRHAVVHEQHMTFSGGFAAGRRRAGRALPSPPGRAGAARRAEFSQQWRRKWVLGCGLKAEFHVAEAQSLAGFEDGLGDFFAGDKGAVGGEQIADGEFVPRRRTSQWRPEMDCSITWNVLPSARPMVVQPSSRS
jgi:hypothetical protein